MKALLAEFDIMVSVAGYPDFRDIDRDVPESLSKGAYFADPPLLYHSPWLAASTSARALFDLDHELT